MGGRREEGRRGRRIPGMGSTASRGHERVRTGECVLGRGPGSNPVAFARSRRDPDPNPRPRPWPSQEEGGGWSEHRTHPAPSTPLFHRAPQQPAGGRRGGREPRHGAPRGGHHCPHPPPCLRGAACGEDRGFSWLPERLPPLPSLEQRCRLVPSSGQKNPNPGLAVAPTEHSRHSLCSHACLLPDGEPLGVLPHLIPSAFNTRPGGRCEKHFPQQQPAPSLPPTPSLLLGEAREGFLPISCRNRPRT